MRRKTNEEFLNEVFDQVNKEYTFIDEYINYQTKLKVRHNKCENIYSVSPSNFLAGYRCPNCSSTRKWTKKKFNKFLDDNKKNIILQEEFKSVHDKVKFYHVDCKRYFFARPNNIRNGDSCSLCYKNRAYTLESIKSKISNITNNEYEFIDCNYINTHTPHLYRHNKCNYEWETRSSNFLDGHRCPNCSDHNNSKGVVKIKNFLNENNIKFRVEETIHGLENPKTNNSLRIDFFLVEKNIYIEYDGEQHYKPFNTPDGEEKLKQTQYLDEVKNNFFNEKELKLVRIPYTEFNNIEKILHQLVKD